MLYHKRLGHLSFSVLNKMYLVLYKQTNKNKLVFDGCEFRKKKLRTLILAKKNRSLEMFDLVHSDV
jgi:GAG-pre-integrase domain